jgi:SNF family Na+-dependent transporter
LSYAITKKNKHILRINISDNYKIAINSPGVHFGIERHHGRQAMMPSFVVLHTLQLLAGRDLSGPHITKGITWSNRL